MEARDERRLLRLQKQMAGYKLLIIDELGFVPLSKTGAELLFELISQRYERGATLITSNLPFDEWTETFGSERLTGALLDRLTHHVHILEMNGNSFRLGQSRAAKDAPINRPQPRIGPRGPTRPGSRQLSEERCCRGAERIPNPSPGTPQVVDLCAGTWPDFPPALTTDPASNCSSTPGICGIRRMSWRTSAPTST